jgi:hypothetical protein
MPQRVGGEGVVDAVNTETEYAGTVPQKNTVQPLGPTGALTVRDLEPHEKLRLGYLTGQEEDPLADRETGFMGGVDSHYLEHPELEDAVPADYRSDDYLS